MNHGWNTGKQGLKNKKSDIFPLLNPTHPYSNTLSELQALSSGLYTFGLEAGPEASTPSHYMLICCELPQIFQ
jgi:hypothetical protein